MCLTIQPVHFYNWRLVCSRGQVINCLVVGYLDVHRSVLLEDRVDIGYELGAQFHRHWRQPSLEVFFLQSLLELVLRDGQYRRSTLRSFILRHR